METRTLDSSEIGVPNEITFRGTNFNYKSLLNKDSTSVLISYKYNSDNREFSSEIKEKLVLKAVDFK